MSIDSNDSTIDSPNFVSLFRQSAPYIYANQDKTAVFVISALALEHPNFINTLHDLALLNALGLKIVLTYGLDHEQDNDQTPVDPEKLKQLIQRNGEVLSQIMSQFSLGLINSPMHGAKVRAITGNFVTAKPKGIINGVDHKALGEIRNVDSQSFNSHLNLNEIIVITPIANSPSGEVFYINPWQQGAKIASKLQADKIIFLGQCELINQSFKGELTLEQSKRWLSLQPFDAMGIRELRHAIVALNEKVNRAYLLDFKINGQLLTELYTRDGCGTLIYQDDYDVIRHATMDDVTGIKALLEPLEKNEVLVTRTKQNLEENINQFQVFDRDGMIIGCAAFNSFGETGELACLVMHEQYRQASRGDMLLKKIQEVARAKGVRQLFVLTTQTAHWFVERGFVKAALQDLPEQRQSLYNIQRNSSVYIKQL
ncbi:amino-acid N-acetyltransferase [Marinicellulosiphila megalodicopiae]|uniref:amino-acid N-acetyltransferase n=1 Tax=Marinicellulosiphila megalodicopiae TaxID=2724896 RepID=UPI003BAF4D56